MLYDCSGYWIDSKQKFENMIISDGTWDGNDDDEDEKIFFYTDGDPVLGEHDEFVVTVADPIDDDEDPPFKQELYSAERKSLLLALTGNGETEAGTLENWRALAYELSESTQKAGLHPEHYPKADGPYPACMVNEQQAEAEDLLTYAQQLADALDVCQMWLTRLTNSGSTLSNPPRDAAKKAETLLGARGHFLPGSKAQTNVSKKLPTKPSNFELFGVDDPNVSIHTKDGKITEVTTGGFAPGQYYIMSGENKGYSLMKVSPRAVEHIYKLCLASYDELRGNRFCFSVVGGLMGTRNRAYFDSGRLSRQAYLTRIWLRQLPLGLHSEEGDYAEQATLCLGEDSTYQWGRREDADCLLQLGLAADLVEVLEPMGSGRAAKIRIKIQDGQKA